jgi:prophage antirepressor-like protein
MQTSTLPAAVDFSGTSLDIIDRAGVPFLSAADLARALGYSRADAVARIYQRNAQEFSEGMALTVSLTGRGQIAPTPTRIFSARGCHLIAMFARTPRAAQFRRWVLDVLERIGNTHAAPSSDYASGECLQLGLKVAGEAVKSWRAQGRPAVARFLVVAPAGAGDLGDAYVHALGPRAHIVESDEELVKLIRDPGCMVPARIMPALIAAAARRLECALPPGITPQKPAGS